MCGMCGTRYFYSLSTMLLPPFLELRDNPSDSSGSVQRSEYIVMKHHICTSRCTYSLRCKKEKYYLTCPDSPFSFPSDPVKRWANQSRRNEEGWIIATPKKGADPFDCGLVCRYIIPHIFLVRKTNVVNIAEGTVTKVFFAHAKIVTSRGKKWSNFPASFAHG